MKFPSLKLTGIQLPKLKLNRKTISIASAGAIGLIILSVYAFHIYFDAATTKPVVLTVPTGSSLAQISARMKEIGVLKHPRHWRLHLFLNGMSEDLKAGQYQITPEDTLYTIGEKMLHHHAILEKFTIVEGWTLKQALAAMEKNPLVETENLNPDELKQQLGLEEDSAEGWIFPDTYLFSKSINGIKLLSQAYGMMKKTLTELWENRMPDLPLKTPYEALILASIVEKESGIYDDKSRIAGVLITRLQRGMRLQSDPTVIYGIGDRFDGDLRKRDLTTDTPYNTYIHRNLPPTPIAMPSRASLEAVMSPHLNGDLYFVSKGNGSHYFSKTYEEHRRAVMKYQLKRRP